MVNLVIESVPPEQTGIATGMHVLMRTLGGAIGVQVAATILSATLAGDGLAHQPRVRDRVRPSARRCSALATLAAFASPRDSRGPARTPGAARSRRPAPTDDRSALALPSHHLICFHIKRDGAVEVNRCARPFRSPSAGAARAGVAPKNPLQERIAHDLERRRRARVPVHVRVGDRGSSRTRSRTRSPTPCSTRCWQQDPARARRVRDADHDGPRRRRGRDLDAARRSTSQRLVRERIRAIGYTRAKYGFDADTCGVIVTLDEQSPDIAQGVDASFEAQQRGDARCARRRRRGRPGDDVRLRRQRDRRS